MVRIILGVIVGFVVWTILWLGSDQVMINTWKDYAVHQSNFELAFNTEAPFTPNSTYLVLNVVRSVIFSIIAGFVAAIIAGENRKTPLALGVLLFLFGLVVEIMAWNLLPIWYHAIFLILLVPMTVIGGRLRTSS